MIQQMKYSSTVEENNLLIINHTNESVQLLLKTILELQKENNTLKNNLKKTQRLLNDAEMKAKEVEIVKNEFLSQISHEIRTPLNIIINYTDLIKDELKDYITEETELFFNAVEVDSNRLIRTIDLILNMSVLNNGHYKTNFENIDLINLLSSAIMDFRLEARDKNLDLIFENTALNKTICADKYAIQQVFINLISNAIKFTEKGFIKIKAYNENNTINIDIEDTGQGISDEYLNKLCEPFTQEDHGFSRKHDGNGLGLAVVKKYLQLNNSCLSVKSKKGRGSVFTFKFKTVCV